MLRSMSHHAVAKLGQAAASALLFSQLLGACAYGEMRQVLRAEVASEANCPDLKVTKVPAYAEGYTENQFKVTGCGIDRVYTCDEKAGLVKFGSADCKYVAGGPKAAPAAAPAPGSGDGAPADDTGGGDLDDSNG
jgi:hypothetical protein